MANPYRDVFYQHQAAWHKYQSAEDVAARHELRRRYYAWYSRNWLPDYKTGEILDIGCGSGQFMYFLRKEGYERLTGLDLDKQQVEIARQLGFEVHEQTALDYLVRSENGYDMIVMLDIIEHFTREELFPLLREVYRKLRTGGRLILSVPNAESPTGPGCVYGDITHETSFTAVSLAEMLFCHGFEVKEMRDPWPAPVDFPRSMYRGLVLVMRKLAGIKYRLLGLEPPRYWSNVVWALAIKPDTREESITDTPAPGPVMDADLGTPPVRS